MHPVCLKGCIARNCVHCHPHNPGSCLNCSQGFYSIRKKIMGNVRCVRQCPLGFTPTLKNDGKKLCKDAQSSKYDKQLFSRLNLKSRMHGYSKKKKKNIFLVASSLSSNPRRHYLMLYVQSIFER